MKYALLIYPPAYGRALTLARSDHEKRFLERRMRDLRDLRQRPGKAAP